MFILLAYMPPSSMALNIWPALFLTSKLMLPPAKNFIANVERMKIKAKRPIKICRLSNIPLQYIPLQATVIEPDVKSCTSKIVLQPDPLQFR